jgi:hypothetical protein
LHGQGNAVAGTGVDLEYFLAEFVLGTQHQPRVIGAVLEVVDDDPLDLDAQSSKNVADQVVRQRPFFRRVPQKHRNGGSDAVIDVNDKRLLVIADENSAAVRGRQHALDLDFSDIIFHGALCELQ